MVSVSMTVTVAVGDEKTLVVVAGPISLVETYCVMAEVLWCVSFYVPSLSLFKVRSYIMLVRVILVTTVTIAVTVVVG